ASARHPLSARSCSISVTSPAISSRGALNFAASASTIVSTFALPSTSFRISTACSSGSISRSGAIMIQRCRVSSKRKTMCGASVKTLALTTMRRSPVISARSLWNESAGRNQARIDIGEIERIELGPQHVALEAQRRQHFLLVGARLRLGLHVAQREVDILRRLDQPRREVGQRLLGDEVVV